MGASTKLAPLHRFNALSGADAEASLMACCASTKWAHTVAAGRPYASAVDLLDAADAACRALTEADVADALSAHPRIGERTSGASTEAQWSRAEQASVSESDAHIQEELHAGNLAYERRFGRVFLVRTAGRSPVDMLAELRRRLDNEPEAELREVSEQLCQITLLRLERLLAR